MANFQIIATGSDYRLEPITNMACSLVVHCRSHGSDLVYPTLASAEEAVKRMDFAIQLRGGKPWAVFNERR